MCSTTLLDDLAYVTKDQAETSVLFELISARYERRSIMITANQPQPGAALPWWRAAG
jgi:DNA replication protein DnaC